MKERALRRGTLNRRATRWQWIDNEGHQGELSKFAGQKAIPNGTLKGDTRSVQEVAASK
jgi:hypothetical protein